MSAIDPASTLPIINDNETDNIWVTWHAISPEPSQSPWREIHILNAQNEIIHTFSLTSQFGTWKWFLYGSCPYDSNRLREQ